MRPRRSWMLALWVGLAATAVYLPSFGARFINLDDPQYTYDNAYILRPSWAHLAAFFTELWVPSTVGGYYQPLTMASLMLDRLIGAQLGGTPTSEIDPFIFHLSNIILHGFNAALVFLVTMYVSRNRGIGAFCGLLFAAHPINVEVVSWVCQRKALLSTSLALLMLLAYGRYGRTGRFRWYFAAAAAFVLSMLAKPTGAFLPLVLLLADVWPLRRWSGRVLLEKGPFLLLAVVFGWIAYKSQDLTTGLAENILRSDPTRAILIVCHNVVFYVSKLIAPIGLCPQYPLPPDARIVLASAPFALGMVGTGAYVALVVVAWRRRWRAIWTMATAFVLLLGPTLGPVRFMGAIAADRFVYMPMIAPLLLLAEALRIVFASGGLRHIARPIGRGEMMAGGMLILSVLGYLTIAQQAVWQCSRTYYQRIIARFPDAPIGYYGMGNWYLEEHDRWLKEGRAADPQRGDQLLDDALAQFTRTLSLQPSFTGAHFRIGEILLLKDRPHEALAIIQEGFRHPNAEHWGYFFLGLAYSHLGQYEKAIGPYKECLRRRPSWREARRNLANALLRTGRAGESLRHYARLYELDPTDVDGLQNWGVALLTVHRPEAALAPLKAAVSIRSQNITQLTGEKRQAEQFHLADARYTLAAALAMTGDFAASLQSLSDAVATKPDLMMQARQHPAFAAVRETGAWREFVAAHGDR